MTFQLDLLSLTTAQEPPDESHEVGGSRPGNPAASVPLAGSPDDHTGGSWTGDHAPAAATPPPAAEHAPSVLAAPDLAIGDRVAIHAPGYVDGESGTVSGLRPGRRYRVEVDLDSGDGSVFTLEELEFIDVR